MAAVPASLFAVPAPGSTYATLATCRDWAAGGPTVASRGKAATRANVAYHVANSPSCWPLAPPFAVRHRHNGSNCFFTPPARVRLSAGRTELSREAQMLCFLAGANSIFYGEKLLTTGNPDVEADRALFADAGIQALTP